MDLLAIVKKRKLKCYVHITRSPGLANTSVEGTVEGGQSKAGQGEDGHAISKSGQASTPPTRREQWRTEKSGEIWLQCH